MTSCVVCERTVTTRQQALQCDRCDGWQHRTCDTGISQDFYRRLCREEVSLEWLCSRCQQTEGTEDQLEVTEGEDTHLTEEIPVTQDGEAEGEEAELSFQSPIRMPRVVLEDSIGDMSVEEDLPVGVEREVTFTLIPSGSKRGGNKLADSMGYAYTVKRRKTTVTYWECSKRPKGTRCPASVVERAGVYRRGDNRHNHPAVVNTETNLKIQAEVRAKAKDDVFKSAHAIVQETMLANVDDTAPNPELPRISNLMRMANRSRETLRPKDPTSLEFEVNAEHVPPGFLRADVWAGDHRHLVFANDKQLALLSKAKTWYCDGTFFVVRPPFTQMFSIHAFIRQGEDYKQIPLVFVLMSGKEKRDYKKVFQKVKEMLQEPRVEHFVMDFEDGMWGAIRSVFPECTRKGCAFHLTQAIFKNIQRLGLQPAYYEKGGAYELMRKLMVLHFLPAMFVTSVCRPSNNIVTLPHIYD
ncbi:hypothetical protein Bbelb_136190 [Branchiostoma belcheri]|nr:hypothetical protein Bbelb_136190 [Branchiostoma belcheri]